MPIYILSTHEIPPEILALLGRNAPAAENSPSEIMRHLLRIVDGAADTLETWKLFAIEPSDPQAVSIVAQTVREGFDTEDFFRLELGPGPNTVLTAHAAASATAARFTIEAVYRRDPDKTGEVLVPKPR